MSQAQWTAVDAYLDSLYSPQDAVLETVLHASHTAGLPPISVAANQGKLLGLLAQMIQARHILEIGTLGAYSTIWLARALPPDGRLITLEVNPRYATVARSNLALADLTERVEVRVGQALDTLATLVAEGRRFDLVFIDADKANTPAYFQQALAMTRVGGLIITDNVVRDGAVIDAASTDVHVQGVRHLHAMIAAEPRVSAVAFQTVGSKGYDGLSIARVLS